MYIAMDYTDLRKDCFKTDLPICYLYVAVISCMLRSSVISDMDCILYIFV